MEATDKLTPGIRGEHRIVVDESNSTSHVGASAATLTSPMMIQMMELAAINAADPHLPAGLTTVGFEVNVKHLAPTPIGKQAWAVAELIEVDGKKLKFKVEAFDEDKQIGVGTHRRAIVRIAE